jgi:hypothetical protein
MFVYRPFCDDRDRYIPLKRRSCTPHWRGLSLEKTSDTFSRPDSQDVYLHLREMLRHKCESLVYDRDADGAALCLKLRNRQMFIYSVAHYWAIVYLHVMLS